jgi:hypothetical protein
VSGREPVGDGLDQETALLTSDTDDYYTSDAWSN